MNPEMDPATDAAADSVADEDQAKQRQNTSAAGETSTTAAVVDGLADVVDLASAAASVVGAGVSGAVEVASAAASVIGGIFSIFDS